MSPFFKAVFVAVLLAGCASTNQHPTVTETPAYAYTGKKCPVSTADISAAIAAAKNSKYFPGGHVHLAMAESRDEIHVMYGDMGGVFVFVKRIRGHWQAVDSGFWNA